MIRILSRPWPRYADLINKHWKQHTNQQQSSKSLTFCLASPAVWLEDVSRWAGAGVRSLRVGAVVAAGGEGGTLVHVHTVVAVLQQQVAVVTRATRTQHHVLTLVLTPAVVDGTRRLPVYNVKFFSELSIRCKTLTPTESIFYFVNKKRYRKVELSYGSVFRLSCLGSLGFHHKPSPVRRTFLPHSGTGHSHSQKTLKQIVQFYNRLTLSYHTKYQYCAEGKCRNNS